MKKYYEGKLGPRIKDIGEMHVGMIIVGGISKTLYEITRLIGGTKFKAKYVGANGSEEELRCLKIGEYHFIEEDKIEAVDF